MELKFKAKEFGIKSAIEIKGKNECNIKFYEDRINFELLLELIQKGIIKYNSREKLIEYERYSRKVFRDIYRRNK